MYRQVDGISMGSVLDPTMAGVFIGFHAVDLFCKGTVPSVYFCYVDDTLFIWERDWFAIFFSNL